MRRLLSAIAAAMLVAIAVAAFLLRAPRIEARPLSKRNPTSYVFHVSRQEARQAVVRALGDRWRGMSFDPQATPDGSIHLQSFHDPIGKSPVYFADGRPLDYLAEFTIEVVERGPGESEVQVTTLRPEVINGRGFGVGSCGPGFANRYVPVEPTSIEEYELLLRVGAALHEKGMPALLLPQ